MVFSFSPFKPRVANEKKSASTPYKCKLVKGSKPLVNFKFYLDIEKHHLSNKIEIKIKELGGSVEFFLGKEVTHFVTDKQQNVLNSALPSPQTPTTPKTPSNLSIDIGSSHKSFSNESKTTKTNSSRADAMLQRSRLHSQDNFVKTESQSPGQLARNLGTSIWSTEQTLKFLDKVLAAINNFNSKEGQSTSRQHNGHHRKLSATTRLLKGNFIKIESFQKHYRPIFKEFAKWPVINLNTTEFACPFESELVNIKTDLNNIKSVSSAMTRKTRTKQKSNNVVKSSSEKQCGYCEICRVEYDLLSLHLKTEKHLNFVKNDDNFLALDNLIKNGATVESFLKLNGAAAADPQNDPCQIFSKRSVKRSNKCNLEESVIKQETETFNEYSPPKTRRSNNLKRESDYNLDGSRRCLRRLSCKPVNYAEPKEDEENTNEDIIEEKKTNFRIRGIRWRAPSPEERPPTVKPILFKVIQEPEVEQLTETNKETIEDGIIMKIKRIRPSELSLLSDEAENFMFPKRESSDSETDDGRQTTSDIAMISTEIISSELDQKKSTVEEIQNRKQIKPVKKKRNHLEKFINDNCDYYKFEDPGSKLRFPNAPTQLNLNEDSPKVETEILENGLRIDSEDRVGETTWELLKNKNIVKQKFSFERVPNNEPWYLAFQRQDEGTEKIFEYYGHTAYRKLPFEMGPLPPLLTDCCFLNQEQSTVDEPDKSTEITETETVKTTLKRGKIKKATTMNLPPQPPVPQTVLNNVNSVNNSIISAKQRKLLIEAELVRKSPREHASTLAILSSLVNQRRKRGSITPVKNDIKSPIKQEMQAVPSISDEIIDDETCDSIISDEILDETEDVKTTPVRMDLFLGNCLSRQIDELLTVSFMDTEELGDMFDIDLDENVPICISDNFEDLVDIVKTNPYHLIATNEITDEMFNKKPANLNRKLTKAECLILARNNRKKYKKNNRTGWPNKKRISIKKEKDEEDEDGDENMVDLNGGCKTFLSTTCKKFKPKSIFNCSQTVFNSINSPSAASRDEFNSDIFTVSSDDQLSLDSSVTNSTTEIKAENDDSVSTRSLFISDEYSSSSIDNLVKLKKIKNNEHVFRKNISKISRRKDKLENKVNAKFNPVVRVKKIDESIILTNYGLRRKSKTSVIESKNDKKKPSTPKKPKVVTTTITTPPISPRKLRKPRGRWYRER